MTEYNYFKAVKDDVQNYINEEINLDEWRGNRDELEEKLNDDLWTCGRVTGNGSGSYTLNPWQAEENICHNLELLKEALEEFGDSKGYLLEHGAEAADVMIRCYLLAPSIAEVLDELGEF